MRNQNGTAAPAIFLGLIVLTLLMSSCSKKEDMPTPVAVDLVGSWSLNRVDTLGLGSNNSITGTMKLNANLTTQNGVWSVKNEVSIFKGGTLVTSDVLLPDGAFELSNNDSELAVSETKDIFDGSKHIGYFLITYYYTRK